MGEVAVKTLTNENLALTQGLHQSNVSSTKSSDLNTNTNNLQIFPNPASDFLNLKIDDFEGGWHLPDDSEWEKLAEYVSADNGGYLKTDDDWNNVGNHLKSSNGWDLSGNGTDDYGFSALPGGARYSNTNFQNIGGFGGWWTATEDINLYPWRRYINHQYSDLGRSEYARETAFTVRCIKDDF